MQALQAKQAEKEANKQKGELKKSEKKLPAAQIKLQPLIDDPKFLKIPVSLQSEFNKHLNFANQMEASFKLGTMSYTFKSDSNDVSAELLRMCMILKTLYAKL